MVACDAISFSSGTSAIDARVQSELWLNAQSRPKIFPYCQLPSGPGLTILLLECSFVRLHCGCTGEIANVSAEQLSGEHGIRGRSFWIIEDSYKLNKQRWRHSNMPRGQSTSKSDNDLHPSYTGDPLFFYSGTVLPCGLHVSAAEVLSPYGLSLLHANCQCHVPAVQ